MSGYDDETPYDRESKRLAEDLATAQPGAFNRFKVNVSNLVYKCTFGKVGTPKTPCCPYSKQ